MPRSPSGSAVRTGGRRFALAVFIGGASFGLLSCDRQPTAIGSPGSGPPSAIVVAIDDAIDQGYSYATADLTVEASSTLSSDSAMADPNTGGTSLGFTTEPQVDNVSLQVGFDANGQSVAVTTYEPDSTDPDPDAIASTKLVAGVVTDYNAAGVAVPVSDAENAEGADPLSELSIAPSTSLVDALVLPPGYDPTCLDPSAGGCTGGDGGSGGCGPTAITSCSRTLGEPRGATRVERHGENEIVIITDIGRVQSAAAAGSVASATTGSGISRREHRRKYVKTDDRWMLAELTNDQEVNDGLRVVRHLQTIRVSRVRYHENRARDEARREARRMDIAAGRASGTNLRVYGGATSATVVDGRASTARPSVPGSRAAAHLSSIMYDEAGGCTDASVRTDDVGQGPDLVFQHGIWSNSCTWATMDPWVRGRYRFGARVKIDTPSTWSYDEQASMLAGTMRSTGQRDFIMIAHSNGGIVSRRVGQMDPTLVRGVIAINSPHHGAPAMRFPIGAVSMAYKVLTFPFRALCIPFDHRGCGEIRMLTDANSPIHKLGFTLDPAHFLGVYSQMIPGSLFQSNLNARPDPFIKVGIVSHSPGKWKWSRLYGDFTCGPEQTLALDGCRGGREHAGATNRTYKHFVKATILAGLQGVGHLLEGDLGSAAVSGGQALSYGSLAAMMRAANWLYDMFVSPRDESDGVVPVRSQQYPYADELYDVRGADTHVGSTRSRLVRDVVYQALQRRFGLLPQTP